MIKPICFGFGSTVKIIDSFFQFIWNIIRTLNIQLLLTVCALWFILANVLPGEALTTAFWVIFAVLAGISAVYAIAATLYSFVRYLRESSKKSPMKKEPVEISIKDVTEEEKPVYFRVAQNPKYVMAEYPDRYELYYDNDGELQFVKITPKQKDNPGNGNPNNGEKQND